MVKEEGFRDVDELTVGLNNGYEPVSVDEPVKEGEKQEKSKPVVMVVPVEKKEAPAKQENVKKKSVKKRAVKKKASKPVRKADEKKPYKKKAKKVNWVPVAILTLVVVVLGVLAYLYFSATGLVAFYGDAERLAAMVNGEPIYVADLKSRHNFFLNTINPFITEEETLNMMIEDKLLAQYATKKGYSVTTRDVEEDMDYLLALNNLNMEGLLENLALMDVDYKDFVEFNKERMLITMLVDEELRDLSEPTDEEVREYYDAYPEQFGNPEMVQVRHILIAFDGPDNETFDEAERVAGLISEDRGNFCDLVFEYTDDIASADTCGEYNFSMFDPLVPEFLEAGFSMEPGEIRIVKTQFGYHIMYKVSDIAAGLVGFDEVESDLISYLSQQKLVNEYQDLVAELRRDAIIEVYSEEETLVTGSVVVSNGASVPVKEVVDTDEARKMNLARCLGALDAQLFKVYWCPYCNDQIEMFGEYIRFIDVVECDPDAPGARPELCGDAEIQLYPSWVIGGEKYQGMRTLNALAALSGCEY